MPEEGRRSFPPREDCRGIGGLYLFRIPGVIEPHQHVVTFVRRAAHRVAHDDDAVADINRVQYAAGLYWYEWVGGLLLLAILVGLYIARTH